MSQKQANVDLNEVAKFDALASSWWDLEGQSKPLHDLNPIRLAYIAERTSLKDANVIDVGCGGGILSEALAKSGAHVTGIDMGEMPLNIAKLHALEEGLTIHYQHITAEEMAAQNKEQYDAVNCLEMLEHVPDPASIISACAGLVKPGGDVFFSTLNRHPKAYLLAVLGAEYIMKMLPKGTHDYKRFIRPAELSAWCRQAGLKVKDVTGMNYNPLTRQFSLGNDVKVNYLIHCKKI
ncbi:2-polyprenyl-3-methyl-5-hydroxy-6-metoxy-1,4-benzoquinol methylase [Methylophaga aminisulfidivorans MP]|uniref:Ubiquinone biosynthesis O-methyltransferase n=1 Tax=Methylophaga aminisulfidivorans MP TaxID=1026882 RepID=F5SWA6_9GAMM|nr:bifunctional 2-polyprenyl-6-hydroxyphenol methylase/3-demethylubiquinol 3-O-methyltransferase UbiG [Methylophaga aminisulfidivorans]EGL56177.1 2-polyprenyl-3-methyl-5-hydroxy-6-metoxy-1,4-benzoquinol methylase [Methylophaga aminisulfidivorans MP]